MSETVINEGAPAEKKWNELIKYNIFIMKLIEFGLAVLIKILPWVIKSPYGHMYCIATGPAIVISLMLIILYLRRRPPMFLEKMHLFFQLLFTFGAFVQCFLLNLRSIVIWLTYGLLYFALLAAIALDLLLIANERGCTFSVA